LEGFVEAGLGEEGAGEGEEFGGGADEGGEGLLGALALADGGIYFAEELNGESGGERENEGQSG
jgi:hypothetical protein